MISRGMSQPLSVIAIFAMPFSWQAASGTRQVQTFINPASLSLESGRLGLLCTSSQFF
jgi:hypothetical protein